MQEIEAIIPPLYSLDLVRVNLAKEGLDEIRCRP